jgi:predicted ester cyclase
MKIYAPNVHVFAFQLYKGANIDGNQLGNDLNFIWESGDAIFKETLHYDLKLSQRIDVNKKPEFTKVDILNDAEVIDDNYAVDFEGKITPNLNQDILVKGFAYPVRISDSYGLWLNLRRPEKENNQDTEELEVDFLQFLNPNNCLIFPEHPLFIGQTILITAWLNNAKNRNNSKQVATECLQQIFPHQNTSPPFYRQGELFGSPIFEYGLPTQSSKYQQVLIWLFTDEKADQLFNQCYRELLDLFFYRNKIIKTYQDSRVIYQQLDAAYRQIESEVDNIPEPENTQGVTSKYLKALQKQLKAFPKLAFQYNRLVLNLEDAQNTIAINADNYSNKLEQIKSGLNGDNLDFLENFLKKSCVTFQRQIQADLGYFQHGSQLLDQAINSIRGIVEIEQTESDRSLETTVQILGIGFGGGAIISGVIVQHIDKINLPPLPKNYFSASLILSMIATIVCTLLAMLGIWIKKRK